MKRPINLERCATNPRLAPCGSLCRVLLLVLVVLPFGGCTVDYYGEADPNDPAIEYFEKGSEFPLRNFSGEGDS